MSPDHMSGASQMGRETVMTLQHARAIAGRLRRLGSWRPRWEGRHTLVTPRSAVAIYLLAFAMVAVASPQDPAGEDHADPTVDNDAQALAVDDQASLTAAEQAILTASDGQADDRFGWSVAASGDTVVVGVPMARVGDNEGQGVVYVFVRSTDGWRDATETAVLTASDGAALDSFGSAVAISGNTIVVGAPLADVSDSVDQGAAYVFTRSPSGWTTAVETAKLVASDGAALDSFGSAVGITRRFLAVGAPFAALDGNAYQGAVYVFAPLEGVWTSAQETAKLTASDGAAGDRLGWSVAVSGTYVIAGAPLVTAGETLQQGAAYLFECPLNGWVSLTEMAKLTPSNGGEGDWFGHSVAMSGTTVAVAAPFNDSGGSDDQGAVYVFVRPEGRWIDTSETAALTAPDGAADDLFGWSVATTGDVILAGVPAAAHDDNASQGAAHVLTRPADGWAPVDQTVQVTASNGAAEDLFGSSVAMSGKTIVIGASAADVGSRDQGSASVFALAEADLAAPTVAIDVVPGEGTSSNEWYVSPVHVTVSAADEPDGSGLAEVCCVVDPGAVPGDIRDLPRQCAFAGAGGELSADGKHSVYAAAEDTAGNESAVTSVAVPIDRTPPTVTCDSPPTFVLNQTGAEVGATVEDALSGAVAPRVVAAADTTKAGTQSVSLSGTDAAGHTTTVSCPYEVVAPRALTFFLHGKDVEETNGGFTMNEAQPEPQVLIVNLLGAPSWFSEPTLTGTFLDAAAFELTIPCSLTLTLSKPVRLTVTNADGSDERLLGEAKRGAGLCMDQETITIPVSTPLQLANQRLKLTISSLSVGVNLNTGKSPFLRATEFVSF
ncbi:MAG: hypothetical protein GEV06_27190 [Luteitalea sp.]|nr:hypothetical protein [Luteitalea sp.]